MATPTSTASAPILGRRSGAFFCELLSSSISYYNQTISLKFTEFCHNQTASLSVARHSDQNSILARKIIGVLF
jgi:hypothetical protein